MLQKYLLVPLASGPLRGLDLTTRAVLGAIYDRYRLSSYRVTGGADGFVDPQGKIFCVFSQSELAELVGVSERSVRRSLAILRDADIITSRKASYSGACRFYIAEDIRNHLRSSQSGQIGRTIRPDWPE